MKNNTDRSWKLVLVCLCFSFFLAVLSPAQAANWGNWNPNKVTPPKPREYDKIVSVDAAANAVTIYDHAAKKDVVYKVTKFTKVTIDGEAGDLSRLRKDMNVELTGNTYNLSKIEANTKVIETKDSKQKKK